MVYQKFKRTLAVCSFALALVAPSQAVVIDDFEDSQGAITNDSASQVAGAGILGGERDAYAGLGSTVQVLSGIGLVSNGLGSFIYDGADGSSTATFGLGGIDLTDGGASDRFLIDILGFSGATIWNVQVFANSGNGLTAQALIAGPGTLEILFSNMAVAGTGVDLTAVNQVNLAFTSVEANEFVEFDNFRTGAGSTSDVPEPGTWLLMAGGLSLVALRRRFA